MPAPDLDLAFHRTVAAFHGDTGTWRRVNRTLELRIVWAREPTDEVRRLAVESLRQAADPDTAITIRDVEEPDRLPSGKGWIVRREL